jgi:hypothetical protein
MSTMSTMSTMRVMAIRGLVIWAVATLALRFGGQYLFRGNNASTLSLLLVSLPVMILAAVALLRPYKAPQERALAAIALVAPGMLLDTVSSAWFPSVFPNIRFNAAGVFGAWLLFCNVVVLLTAVVVGGNWSLAENKE